MNWNQRIKELLTGEWAIASKLNNNKVLDINNNDSPYNVTIWERLTGDNQKWTIEFDSTNRAFVIRSVAYRNKVLTRSNPNQTNGTNVLVTNYGTHFIGDINQRWYLHYDCKGYYVIANYIGNYLNPEVLDLANSNTTNGTNIQVKPITSKDNQCFYLIR